MFKFARILHWFKREQSQQPPRSIMLLSDEPQATELAALLSNKMYRVQIAKAVADALQLMEDEGLPDVFVGNFVNVAEDGKHFVEKARVRFGKSAMPPIIFLMDSIEDEATAHELLIDDLFMKPINQDSFLASIDRLIAARTFTERPYEI